MKKILFFIIVLAAFVNAEAQTSWVYNFGTATVVPITGTTMDVATTKSFPATETNGGTPYVRGSSGGVSLEAGNQAGGDGAELKIVNYSDNSAKFSISGFSSPSLVASVEFKIKFTKLGGRMMFVLGSGNTFTDGAFKASHMFGLGFTSNTTTGDVTVTSYANGYNTIPSAPILNVNTVYVIKICANNSGAAIVYKEGVQQTLLANSFDVYINGVLTFNDLSKGTTFPEGTAINALGLFSNNTSFNATSPGTIFMDDLKYANFLPEWTDDSTAIKLAEINAIKTKYINWITGEGADFNRAEVKLRYNQYVNKANNAKKALENNTTGQNYDLDNPGAPWSLGDNADSGPWSTFVQNYLIPIVSSYKIKGLASSPNTHYNNPAFKTLIIKMFNYLEAKGINSTTDFGSFAPINGSAYATSVLLMRDELEQEGKLENHLGALKKLTEYMDSSNAGVSMQYTGANLDVLRHDIQKRLCYILTQSNNSPTKVADMDFYKTFVNNAFSIAKGLASGIKSDLITYHHAGPYSNGYGVGAMNEASVINLILKGTGYELSANTQQKIFNCIMTWQKLSNGFELHRGLAGRGPNNTTSMEQLRPALSNLYVTDPVAFKGAGLAFKRLSNVFPSANNAMYAASTTGIVMQNGMYAVQDMMRTLDENTAGTDPSGHFSFPYAGLSVQKYNGYMAGVKGTSKHVWNYEGNISENHFGTNISAGAMELMTVGNPITRISNGYNDNGWDWVHLPGTTVASIPLADLPSPNRQFSDKDFMAHASLGNNGVFAMDFHDMNSTTLATALKTNFFYKDKILCLGSDIKDVNGTNQIHTTLFQTALPLATTLTTINGATRTGTSDNFTQTGGSLWATDAVGNGFVVPASSTNTSEIIIKRGNQVSRNAANTADNQGDFATAYINHGANPNNGSYRYAVIMQGGTTNTQAFANNFASYFDVLQQNTQAHVVKYVEDNTFNYVVFDANSTFTQDAVKKVDKPAIVITQAINTNAGLKVSLTNPNLGILAPGEFYTWSQWSNSANVALFNRAAQTQVVKLTLAGKWALTAPTANVVATNNGNDTEVAFSTINGLTVNAELAKIIDPVSMAAMTSSASSVPQNSTSPIITFTGTNGAIPYTFTYNINGGASETVTTTGTDSWATVSMPTNATGTFVYNLLTVADATRSQVQSGSATVVVSCLPEATISGTTSVCQSGTAPVITFTGAKGTAPYTFTYNVNGSSNRTVTTNDTTAILSAATETAGTFTYTLVSVADANTSQLQNGTATVMVNALPAISISSYKGTTVAKSDAVILTAIGGTQYSWTGADIISGQANAAVTIKPNQSGTYKVSVTNAVGCVSDQSITITVIDDTKLEANNVVTPNGDGHNDKFIVKNIEYYPNNTLKIFNRAGRILYNKRGYANEWDGTLNGNPLAVGTYYYIIDLGNRTRAFKGYINIVRN